MANPLKMLKLKPTTIQFIQEVPIEAPPAKVWKAILNASAWFGFDPDRSKWTQKTSIDPRIGGLFQSASKDGSEMRLYGVVSHIEPNKVLRISGPMGMTHLPVSTT